MNRRGFIASLASLPLLATPLATDTISVSRGAPTPAAGCMETDNYTPGVKGWRIDGDGNLEVNDVIIRGTIYARDIKRGPIT